MSGPLTDYLLSLGPTLLGVSSEELSATLSETAAGAAGWLDEVPRRDVYCARAPRMARQGLDVVRMGSLLCADIEPWRRHDSRPDMAKLEP